MWVMGWITGESHMSDDIGYRRVTDESEISHIRVTNGLHMGRTGVQNGLQMGERWIICGSWVRLQMGHSLLHMVLKYVINMSHMSHTLVKLPNTTFLIFSKLNHFWIYHKSVTFRIRKINVVFDQSEDVTCHKVVFYTSASE